MKPKPTVNIPPVTKPNAISNTQLAAKATALAAGVNNTRSAPYKPCELELQPDYTTAQDLRILARSGQSSLKIWTNNQISEVDMSNFPDGRQIPISGNIIDSTSQTVAANSRYLIWALFNADNTFDRFGFTLKPLMVYTAVSGGTVGALATYTTAGTGTNNCYSMQVGQTVTVRNNDAGAGAPNFQWNYGTVIDVVSATSITILMWDGPNAATNITSTTSAQIQAWDHFKCWDGTSSAATVFTNARLIGELLTQTGSLPMWVRGLNEPYWLFQFGYPDVTRTNSAGTTSTSYDSYRYGPPWASLCHVVSGIATTATATIGRYASLYGSTASSVGQQLLGIHSSANIITAQIRQEQWIPLTYGSRWRADLVFVASTGTITISNTILGYNDQGLRE